MTERKITKSDCKYYRESDGNCLNFTYVGEYDPCTDGDLEHCYEKFPHFFNKDERMTEKRFKIVDEQFISYYGGTGYKISNEECGFWLWHNKNESQKVCDKLNSILDENGQLKQHNTELINKIDFLERVIDGDV